MSKMKITQKDQIKLNEAKKLFDTRCRSDINTINLNASTTKSHQERVNEICLALYYDLKTPFFTDVTFKTGYRPDIFAPLYLGGAFIEIRQSETEEKSKEKKERVPDGFITIYSDCSKPFKLKDIQ